MLFNILFVAEHKIGGHRKSLKKCCKNLQLTILTKQTADTIAFLSPKVEQRPEL
jgi:hypothetical protein